MPVKRFCDLFQSAMDFLLQNRFMDKSQPPFDGSASSSGGNAPLSSLRSFDEASALAFIGAEKRLEPELLAPLPDWLRQQYLLLNALDSLVLAPPQTARDGGQRYFVELTPWDSSNGSYYSMALAWAALATDFPPAQYAQLGWNLIHPTQGHASAFGSCDIVGQWTRRQAWREWSSWTFDFSLLKSCGLAFKTLSLQSVSSVYEGLNQALPFQTRSYSLEQFGGAGTNFSDPERALSGVWTEAGQLTIEIGAKESVPEIPSAPQSGTNIIGWKLDSLGPFAAVLDYAFGAAS
jgi:hypothetical protein